MPCSPTSPASLVYLRRKVSRTKEGVQAGPCSAKDGVEKRSEAQEGSLASDNSGLAGIPSPPGPKASGKQSGGREKPEAGRLSEMKY